MNTIYIPDFLNLTENYEWDNVQNMYSPIEISCDRIREYFSDSRDILEPFLPSVNRRNPLKEKLRILAAFVHGEGLITQDEYDLMKILQYREFKDFGMQVSEIFSRHIRALRKSGIEDIINIENLGYYYGNPANVRDGFKVFSNQFISNSVLFGRVSYHLDLRIVRIDDLKIQLGVKEFDYMMRRLRGINETDEDVQGRVVPLQFVRAKFMPHKFTLTPGNRHDRVVKFTSY